MKRKSSIKHSIQHKGIQYPVIVREDVSGGYWVNCPALDGCYSQGDTIDAALDNVREAIMLCLEDAPSDIRRELARDVSLHFVRV